MQVSVIISAVLDGEITTITTLYQVKQTDTIFTSYAFFFQH